MDKWMGMWVDGWMDGWAGMWVGGRQTDGLIDGWVGMWWSPDSFCYYGPPTSALAMGPTNNMGSLGRSQLENQPDMLRGTFVSDALGRLGGGSQPGDISCLLMAWQESLPALGYMGQCLNPGSLSF